jgi:hypothetical protein
MLLLQVLVLERNDNKSQAQWSNTEHVLGSKATATAALCAGLVAEIHTRLRRRDLHRANVPVWSEVTGAEALQVYIKHV